MLLTWALRILLLIVVVRAVLRFVYGLAQGLRSPADEAKPRAALVRDPVCGTFVVPNQKLSLSDGSTRHYFCSQRCRDAYEARAR